MTCYRHMPFQFPHRALSPFFTKHSIFCISKTTQFRSKDKQVYKSTSFLQMVISGHQVQNTNTILTPSLPGWLSHKLRQGPWWPHLHSRGPQREVPWLVDSLRVQGKPQPPLLKSNDPEHTGSWAKRRRAGTTQCACQSPRE